eukprot:TRINITY_DN3011_c0_g1_i1.p2 TRINITY_DN3011_c0_g1~~TRINITY_DN3011_c0_g1_i1.p2  ORF type:complete len:227 (-),score=21.84 TRINITY_DN3011_c0_g1_i1:372-1052(-)
MMSIIFLSLFIVAYTRSLSVFSASFTPTVEIQGDRTGFVNMLDRVSDQSSLGQFGGSLLGGIFASSANDFSTQGLASNIATSNNGAVASFGVFNTTAANFGDSISNSTIASASQTQAFQNGGQTVAQGGLQQLSNGTSVLNGFQGQSSLAGFAADGFGVGSQATFQGSSNVEGLLPTQNIGAITWALANLFGTAAACSGASQTSFLYGVSRTTTGCTVQSAIVPLN